jgi:hypothetical protein
MTKLSFIYFQPLSEIRTKQTVQLETNIILAAKDHTINTAYVSQAIYYTYDGIVIVNDPQNTTQKSKNEKLES